MATIVHFDISADEPERARKFYEEMFGWKFSKFPGPMEYYLIETQGLNGAQGVGGGLAKRDDPKQVGLMNYIQVASIDNALNKATALGGKVITPKQTMPGVGFMAMCEDTDGNPFGLFEAEVKG